MLGSMEVGEDGWIGEVDVVHLMATLGAGDVATTRMDVEEVVSAWMFILYFLDLMYQSELCNISGNIQILFYFLCDISIRELICYSCYSMYHHINIVYIICMIT